MDISGRKAIHRERANSDPCSENGSQEQDSDGHHEHDCDDTHTNISRSYEKLENEIQNSPTVLKNRKPPCKKQCSKDEHKNSFVPESANRDGQSSNGGTNMKTMLCCIILCIAAIFVVIVYFYFVPTSSKNSLKCSYPKLKERYPNESFWKTLQFGIEDILNNISDKPAVYLFVHNSKEAPKIIHDIAYASSSCFDSDPAPKILDFKAEQAKKDYGYIIEKYKTTIKEGNVILIVNLNEIPAEAAKALHAICDTVSPLVKKVIIFLSLSAKPAHDNEKVIETAENALRQLWEAEIKPNELDPIITRVTDQVLLMQSN